jgi:voltage-gated potassium channel Kch
VPAVILERAFRQLDENESVHYPGKMYWSTIEAALRRFDNTFNIQDRDYMLIKMTMSPDSSNRNPLIAWENVLLFDEFVVDLNFSERIYFTFDLSENSTRASKLVSTLIILCVFVATFAYVGGSLWKFQGEPVCTEEMIDNDVCEPRMHFVTNTIIDVCTVCFTIEYLVRLLTCTNVRFDLLDRQFLDDLLTGDEVGHSVRGASSRARKLWMFVSHPWHVIDLICFLPHWIEMFILRNEQFTALFQSEDGRAGFSGKGSVQFLRGLRFFSSLRVFKLGRMQNNSRDSAGEMLDLFKWVVRKTRPALVLAVALLVVGLFVFGTLMWNLEGGSFYPLSHSRVQGVPGIAENTKWTINGGVYLRENIEGYEISPFASIPSSFWYVFVTMTTVGYGDAVPASTPGKTIGFILMLYGALLWSLPIGVLSATFAREFDRRMQQMLARERAIQKQIARDEDQLDQERSSGGKLMDAFASWKDAFLTLDMMGLPLEDVPNEIEALLNRIESEDTKAAKDAKKEMDRLTMKMIAWGEIGAGWNDLRASWYSLLLEVSTARPRRRFSSEVLKQRYSESSGNFTAQRRSSIQSRSQSKQSHHLPTTNGKDHSHDPGSPSQADGAKGTSQDESVHEI